MRLSRLGYRNYTNRKPRPLAEADEMVSGNPYPPSHLKAGCSFDGREFSLRIRGGDGNEESRSTYWYEITLTLKEMRTLLSHSLSSPYWDFPGGREISGAERELWGTLFDLWEKRLKKLVRKRSR